MSLCLSDDDLRELTKKVRPSAQARVLDEMGIPWKPRRSGGRLKSLAVLRIHVEGVPKVSPSPGARLPAPEPQLMP